MQVVSWRLSLWSLPTTSGPGQPLTRFSVAYAWVLLDYSLTSTKPDPSTSLQRSKNPTYVNSSCQACCLFFGALSSYLLTNITEKGEHWALFSGWNSSKIRDHDACGSMLCNGVRMFSLAFAVMGILMMLDVVANDMLFLIGTFVYLAPLFFSMHRAKRLFGKENPAARVSVGLCLSRRANPISASANRWGSIRQFA